MEKNKFQLIALLAIVILAVGGLLIYKNGINKSVETSQNSFSQSTTNITKLTISPDKKIVSYEGQTGKTALEILKSLTVITTQQSNYGEFVTDINGIKAENGKQFWAFYVNGVLASEAAGSYISTNGEKIEWKIEAIKL